MKTVRRVAINFFELGVVKNFMQNSVIDCNSIIYQFYRVSDTYFLKNIIRSSQPEVFLGRDVLKICSKFTGAAHAEV